MINYHALGRNFAKAAGFHLRRMPPSLLASPKGLLEVNLELVAVHLSTRLDQVFFVQVGANDGDYNDPFLVTAERLGWRGMLVEPQPDVFARLERRCADRPGLVCVNAALDKSKGTREFFRVRPDAPYSTDVSGLASFDRSHLLKHDRQFPGIADHIETIEVACETFDSLLEQSGELDFDVLQVDVEGFDAEVVAMAELGRRRTSLVNFEHKHLKRTAWDACVSSLLGEGFKVTRTWQDTLAYREPRMVGSDDK